MRPERFAACAALLFGGIVVLNSGCKGLVGAMAGADLSNADAESAPNPLKGGVVKYETESRQTALQGLRPSDCTMWPLKDTFSVTATADQLCVDATTHFGYSSGPGPSGEMPKWSFVGDGAKVAALELKAADTPRKIGMCTKHVANVAPETNAIWVVRTTGCAPNNGLLSASSSRLSLRQSVPIGDYDLAAWKLQ